MTHMSLAFTIEAPFINPKNPETDPTMGVPSAATETSGRKQGKSISQSISYLRLRIIRTAGSRKVISMNGIMVPVSYTHLTLPTKRIV